MVVGAGTSGFLSISDSDRRVPAELGQESQASSFLEDGTPLASRFFSSCGGILELRRGSQPSPWVGPGKPNLPLGLRGKAGECSRVTAGQKRPHLDLCSGPSDPLQGRQGSRVCITDSPGCPRATSCAVLPSPCLPKAPAACGQVPASLLQSVAI